MNKRLMRVLTALAIAALLMGTMPSALAAKSFKAVVTSDAMKVYSKDSPHDVIGKVKKGETVTVKAYSGNAALISYNGKTGIARVSDLTTAPEGAQDAPTESTEGKAVVTSKSARVYKKANTKSGYVTVKAGTALTLLSTSGNIAKVERNGTVGYIDARCLEGASTTQETAPTVETTENAAGAVQKYDRKPVETTRECRVYAQPAASSAYVSVEKGARLVLLATKGSCAMVERDGKVGYMDKANLAEVETTSAVSAADNAADSKVDLSGNNEEIVYKFLIRVMGYNTAAAVGVMANIKYESGYKPTSGGDNGTSYGIAQWHAGRKNRLIEWCGSNGFDYTTLEGQLYYLDYELRNRYPAVHRQLLEMTNDEQGAYDAGYLFCYSFEAPANRANQSDIRGNYARGTLWNRYKT